MLEDMRMRMVAEHYRDELQRRRHESHDVITRRSAARCVTELQIASGRAQYVTRRGF